MTHKLKTIPASRFVILSISFEQCKCIVSTLEADKSNQFIKDMLLLTLTSHSPCLCKLCTLLKLA